MITCGCVGCGKSLQVKDEWAGKRVQCPGCGTAFTVPSPWMEAEEVAAVVPTVATPGQSRPAVAVPQQRRRSDVIDYEIFGEEMQYCEIALVPSVHYDIQLVGGVKNTLFGGEGLFLATLTGPGRVWLQSLPFSRLAGRVLANARGGGASKDEGSVLGGLGSLFMGDN
ncbi:MAG: AIM24 family protein [Pirellulales bacterium]